MDKSSYYLWTDELVSMIQSGGNYANLYTDLSYFDFHNIAAVGIQQFTGPAEINNFIDAFSDLLNANPKLKQRILFGSDWLMTELEYAGVSNFYHNICLVLREVSKKVGWDTWYQFTVLNNLRFLGLLDDSDKFDKTRLLQYCKNLGKAYAALPNGTNRSGKRKTPSLTETDGLKKELCAHYDALTNHKNSYFAWETFNEGQAITKTNLNSFVPTTSDQFLSIDKKKRYEI